MRFSCSVIAFAASIVLAAAKPSHHYREHAKRADVDDWEKVGRPDHRLVVPVRVGLKQQNLEYGARALEAISNPKSPKYGQHWSLEKLIGTFRPKDESFRAVHEWLADSGVDRSRIAVDHSHFINFNATIAEVEALLRTEYHIFQEVETDNEHIACDSYQLPAHLLSHVDIITPTVHFNRPIRRRGINKRKAAPDGPVSHPIVKPIPPGQSEEPHAPLAAATQTAYGAQDVQSLITTNTARCYYASYLGCLRYLYNIPISFQNATGNSFGMPEYAPNNYNTSDNTLFYNRYSRRQVGTQPTFDSVDGGTLAVLSMNNEVEPSLDFQIAALTWPQGSVLYQSGSNTVGASFGNFLDAIDGSYCTYDGGDNPNYDYQYFNGSDCGKYSPPLVLSTSYGYNEFALGIDYATRQCYEYMKLGLAGTTVLFSSGDYGVAGNGGYCGGQYTSAYKSKGYFEPAFPSTCPWVTSVGSTQVIGTTNVGTTSGQSEQSTNSFASGGGFSNYFAMPSYQASAVASYYANYPPSYSAALYNNSRRVRSYPDVSASGYDFITAISGAFYYVGGTSMSSPVFASIMTLINQERLFASKSPVGFINPALYANPSLLTDVTVGSNPGCGQAGFNAEPGWDPLSGLGTPNYQKMVAYFLSLP